MPPTRDWVLKAQGDLRVMRATLRTGDDLTYDAVCFHAQQCIEKLLKALLQFHGEAVPKTHDLRLLIKPMLSIVGDSTSLIEKCAVLSEYAVGFRYPGETASRWVAEEAASIAEELYLLLSDVLPKDQLDLPF
jgi:HEPN domain-containing protein